MMKRSIAFFLAALLLLTIFPAAGAEEDTKLVLTGKTQIEVGESAAWTAEVTPVEKAGEIRWIAGWPAVATVDENGVITGHRAGDCHITAIAPDGTKKTETVHVVSYDVSELQLAGKTVIGVGETVTWTAKPLPEGTETQITWAAGWPAVATVDENGAITGHRVGDCHITATAANGVKKTVTVHVREIEDLQLIGVTHISPGETTTWRAKPLPEGLQSKITWSAGYPAVATVDENGTITAHKLGDCHITATASNGVKRTVMLHVMSAEEAEIAEHFPDTLASYDSPHTAIAARTNNLILACREIDGKIVQPGEVFSFNETVGERTPEKGYQAAIVYTGGTSTPAIGGGVCQVASTIYLCTLLADLQVVERTEHMFACTYVPLGMDATIYWGSLDYKFRNTTAHPILLRASVSGGYVHIKLLGKKESDVTVRMTYNVLSTTPWSEVEKVDPTKEPGYRSTTVTPYTGYTVQTYKNWYDAAGKLLKTEKCAYSTYRKRDRVVTVGPAAAPATTVTPRAPRGR